MKLVFKIVMGVLLPLAVVGGSIAAGSFLMATAPKTERTVDKRLPPMVEVLTVSQHPMSRVVEAFGTVRPAQEVSLSLEVGGRITSMHPALQPGGTIRSGELLVAIDKSEYELALSRAKAALQETQAALEVELGRQRVAEREWELFGKDLPDAELGRELMLREPQLNQAKARIASAESDVAKAELDLKRTEIYAPFDAMVLEELVDVGQQATPGDTIATLVGTDAFWIQASVRAAHLGAVLEAEDNGACGVRVYSEIHSGQSDGVEAKLLRHMGQVDPDGRMALVLIEVDDPLALNADDPNQRPLPLNTYVRVEIDAGQVENAIPIPRSGLRENDKLWVADASNHLQIRQAEIVWQQVDEVAIVDVFEPGDRLILSPLEHALPGMEVRTKDSAPAQPEMPPA
ncbi:MAG: hypothetical protein AMXMBFR84_29620 [Candidatus Hydrogenedentota bacterium]